MIYLSHLINYDTFNNCLLLKNTHNSINYFVKDSILLIFIIERFYKNEIILYQIKIKVRKKLQKF